MVYNSYKEIVIAKIRVISINIQGVEQEYGICDGRRVKRIEANNIYSVIVN